jgi:proteic killer suppression protein
MRLASLLAAENLVDMDKVPGHCHALTEDRAGQFALDLWGPYRLIFEPANDPVPRTSDQGIDRPQVTQVRILEIADYHGH